MDVRRLGLVGDMGNLPCGGETEHAGRREWIGQMGIKMAGVVISRVFLHI